MILKTGLMALMIAGLLVMPAQAMNCARSAAPPQKYDYVRKKPYKIVYKTRAEMRLPNGTDRCGVAPMFQRKEFNIMYLWDGLKENSIAWRKTVRHEQGHFPMDDGSEGWRHPLAPHWARG